MSRGDRRLCGATNRRGEPCRALAMTNGRCKNHGGKSLGGAAHPNYRHGQYARSMPKRLQEAAWASLSDPDRLALVEDLAIIDARTIDVLSRVESGESGVLWHELRAAWRNFKTARRHGDTVVAAVHLDQVGALIAAGANDAAAWNDVLGLIERRRKLVESERRHQIESQQMVSVEHAWALMASLVETVLQHVTDPLARREIAAEFQRRVEPKTPDC